MRAGSMTRYASERFVHDSLDSVIVGRFGSRPLVSPYPPPKVLLLLAPLA